MHLIQQHCLVTHSVAATHLQFAFRFEARTVKDNPLPEALVELAEKVNKSIDEAMKRVKASPYAKQKRIVSFLDFARQKRRALLTTIIMVLRNHGKQAALKRFVSENAVLLEENSVPVDEIAPIALPPKKTPAAPKDSHWAADGTVLAITQVLLEFYQGLAAEDPAILNKCLFVEEGYLDGRAYLKKIDLELSEKGGFDTILVPRFEVTTKISVGLTEDGLYDVRILGLRKRLSYGIHVIEHRQSDRFIMKYTDNGFKILLKEEKE